MSVHPIEALLRPPVEAWSASTAAVGAAICLLAPWALFMTPGVAYGAAFLFGWLAWHRGRQAWRVLRYQRHMRSLPRYRMRADQIPWSPSRL
ncbi:MAG: conjugative coupling factor TraD, PFGI-1 class, partial [Gammaproteobacteria bacterium]|nr:conjugative coupling factor TraD, PFGI-1 class [Gammaproteobacteria bacterium]